LNITIQEASMIHKVFKYLYTEFNNGKKTEEAAEAEKAGRSGYDRTMTGR
jgi:hypothetical protein